MDGVFQWIKSIVFYLILLTAVTHLMPNNKYVRYVRIFSGMLMVVIVIRPVMGIFSSELSFDKTFEKMLNNSESVWEGEKQQEQKMQLDGIREESFLKEYEKQVEQFVKAEARGLGLQVTECSVWLTQRDYEIIPEKVEVRVRKTEEEQEWEKGKGERTEKNRWEEIDKISIEKITIRDVVETDKQSNDTFNALQSIISSYYGMEERHVLISESV